MPNLIFTHRYSTALILNKIQGPRTLLAEHLQFDLRQIPLPVTLELINTDDTVSKFGQDDKQRGLERTTASHENS